MYAKMADRAFAKKNETVVAVLCIANLIVPLATSEVELFGSIMFAVYNLSPIGFESYSNFNPSFNFIKSNFLENMMKKKRKEKKILSSFFVKIIDI